MRTRKINPLRWMVMLGIMGGLVGLGAVALMGASGPQFDGNRAFEILKRQCDFGPRPVGTLAHEKTRAYLLESMKQVTDKAETQDFDWSRNGKKYRLSNIIGVINPDAPRKVMISAHWDTRPTADLERTVAEKSKPIIGANDGASGVAVVLELARVLKAKRPQVGVIFMLFDGEDVGPTTADMFLGAKHFAKNMGSYRPERMILVDMIGDKDLNIKQELNSLDSEPALVQKVWDTAARLGYSAQFPKTQGYNILDDHIPMIDAGVPSIDLIDFDYPTYPPRAGSTYWHTHQDTVDKCSPESLKAVGHTLHEVVMNW